MKKKKKKTFSANALIARPRHIIREQLLKQLFDRNAKMSCLVRRLWLSSKRFSFIAFFSSAYVPFFSLRQIELGLHIYRCENATDYSRITVVAEAAAAVAKTAFIGMNIENE